MPMYKLVEYTDSCSNTGNLWQYHRDKVDDDNIANVEFKLIFKGEITKNFRLMVTLKILKILYHYNTEFAFREFLQKN